MAAWTLRRFWPTSWSIPANIGCRSCEACHTCIRTAFGTACFAGLRQCQMLRNSSCRCKYLSRLVAHHFSSIALIRRCFGSFQIWLFCRLVLCSPLGPVSRSAFASDNAQSRSPTTRMTSWSGHRQGGVRQKGCACIRRMLAQA